MRPSLVTDRLQRVLDACSEHRSGEVADDVPQLADADPGLFGLALATLDGHVHEVGDSRRPFTLQSLSKPFAYALALADRGYDDVAEHVGVEPSGESYDAISLDPLTDRPRNPMINAGAIATTSLVRGSDAGERSERVRALCSGLAGRELEVDEDAAAAEVEAGQRNRAIAHLLQAHGMLGVEDPEDAVRAYARQCAVLVDVRDLAVMGATLAGGGLSPLTGERVLRADAVRQVLAVMLTCGLYDAAGDWAATVGLPAKSGVSGGLLAVAPSELGVGAWSPRLDRHGRSVRGLEAVRRLSADLDLHALHVRQGARPPLRSSHNVAERPSLRPRVGADTALLAQVGSRARVHELHGDVQVAAAEQAVRAVEEAWGDLDVVVLDLRAVDEIVPAAARLLKDLASGLRHDGRRALLVDPVGLVAAALTTASSGDPEGDVDGATTDEVVDDRQTAVAAAEEELLSRHRPAGGGQGRAAGLAPADHPLLAGLAGAEVSAVEGVAADLAVDDGAAAEPDVDALHLVLTGVLTKGGPTAPGASVELGPGTCAGGPAEPLPADGRVVARGDVRALVLDRAALERLRRDAPGAAARLWEGLAAHVGDRAERLAREVAAADAG